MKRIISVILVCAALILPSASVPVRAEGLMPALSRELVNLYPSQSFRLTVTDTKHSYTLTSADENVVCVDEEGVLHAVGVGITEVTCRFASGGTSVCTVNVKEGKPPEMVKLSQQSMTLVQGETELLKSAVYPDKGNPYRFYTSSDEDIARVDQDGNIEAVKPGTAVITVESESSAVSSSCIVRVISSSGENIFGSDISGVLYNVTGERLTGTKLELKGSISSSEAATDDQGRFCFTDVSTGSYLLTVLPNGTDNASVSANVNINSTDIRLNCILSDNALTVLYGSGLSSGIMVSDIVLISPSADLSIGDKYDLPYTVYPSQASGAELKFSTSAPEVAQVDASGRITAVGEGTAFVSVSDKDGRIMKKCTVHVSQGGIGSFAWAIIFLQIFIILLLFAILVRKQENKIPARSDADEEHT